MSQTWKILQGDVRERLRDLDDGSVHTAITSPPYHALRDYKAGKGELGSEATFDEWLETQVGVMAQVRRVLRDDGTLWVNMGDNYEGGRSFKGRGGADGAFGRKAEALGGSKRVAKSDIPERNMVGQPWRLAFALRDDGWFLRACIVWHKPSILPESVTSRPTIDYEFVFMMTKQASGYFYDADAVRQPLGESMLSKLTKEGERADTERNQDETAPGGHRQGGNPAMNRMLASARSKQAAYDAAKANLRGIKGNGTDAGGRHRGSGKSSGNVTGDNTVYKSGGFGAKEEAFTHPLGANLRSVWSIPAEPLRYAHFASFPRALVRRMIRAGTSAHGVCSRCGAPWRRLVVDTEDYAARKAAMKGAWTGSEAAGFKGRDGVGGANRYSSKWRGRGMKDVARETQEVGWEPTCGHRDAPVVPATVLDPYGGSMTTVVTALEEGRSGVACELSPRYVKEIGLRRIREAGPSFLQLGSVSWSSKAAERSGAERSGRT